MRGLLAACAVAPSLACSHAACQPLPPHQWLLVAPTVSNRDAGLTLLMHPWHHVGQSSEVRYRSGLELTDGPFVDLPGGGTAALEAFVSAHGPGAAVDLRRRIPIATRWSLGLGIRGELFDERLRRARSLTTTPARALGESLDAEVDLGFRIPSAWMGGCE
jgi:hypothetical protein